MKVEEVIIPTVLFLALFGIVLVVAYFVSQVRTRKLETLVKIVEQGGVATPELIDMLSYAGGPNADLRKGLIWLAIGLPLTLGIGLEAGWKEGVFGTIPVFVGIAYLIVMKFGYGKSISE
jgi:hypothetical protein